MGDKLTLEVLIKTVLEAAGVQAGTAEIKQLAGTIEKTTEAGKQLEITSKDIVEGLEKQRAAAMSTGKAWEDLSASEKEAQRETAQRAVRLIEADDAAKKAAASSTTLAKNLGTLKEAGAGVQQVISGLLTGNLFAVGQGIAGISKAITAASAATKAWLAELALFTAAVSALAAPFAAIIVAFRQYADELVKANKRIQDAAVKSSEARAKAAEESSARIQKVLEKELKALNEIEAAYEKSQKRTDELYANEAKKREAQRGLRDSNLNIAEKQALDRAQSDEERERIRREFERKRTTNEINDKFGDLATSDYQGKVNTLNAEETIRKAQAQFEDAQENVRAAQREFDSKQNAWKSIRDPGAREAAEKDALAARDRLKEVKAAADKVADETTRVIAAATAQIETAKNTKELTEINRQMLKLSLQQQARDRQQPGATTEDLKDAKNIISGVKAATDLETKPQRPQPVVVKGDTPRGQGTITRGGETLIVPTKDTEKAVREALSTFDKVGTLIEQFAGGVVDRSKKLETNLQNERERAGGG